MVLTRLSDLVAEALGELATFFIPVSNWNTITSGFSLKVKDKSEKPVPKI